MNSFKENKSSAEKKKKSGIFGSKNLSINSRPRMVDATMTAYKLLESAFIN